MATFTAQFSGKPCINCEERIHAGDEVTYATDGALVHADCESTSTTWQVHDSAPRRQCRSCFLDMAPAETGDICEDCS